MSGRPLRVVVVAEESAGVQALERISSFAPAVEIASVLTNTRPRGGHRALVADAAERLDLPTAPAELVRSPAFVAQLRRERIDLLVNVHSLYIVDAQVLATPRIGSFNLHPGPLPEYAGLNAPSWSIYNGETSHAVTLHWMEAAIDAGPVAWSETFELSDGDTGLSVSGRCVRAGVPLIARLIETALRDPSRIPRTAQDGSRRRYLAPGPPNDGVLEWTRPAAEISRFVRAADYAPFPSPWGHPSAVLDGHRVGIAKVQLTGVPADATPGTVCDVTDVGAVVATSDELIVVQRLSIDGRYAKPAALLRD